MEIWVESCEKGSKKKYSYIYMGGKIYQKPQNVKGLHRRLPQPVILIQAFVQRSRYTGSPKSLLNQLNEIGFKSIIKANAASHPQYPCGSLFYLNDNPYSQISSYFLDGWLQEKLGELRHLQAEAMTKGLCKAYPHTLAITHIACGAI
jgi:hypothetical protein